MTIVMTPKDIDKQHNPKISLVSALHYLVLSVKIVGAKHSGDRFGGQPKIFIPECFAQSTRVSGAEARAKHSGDILSVLKLIFFAECFAPTICLGVSGRRKIGKF